MKVSMNVYHKSIRLSTAILLLAVMLGGVISAMWYTIASAQATQGQASATSQLFLPMISREGNGQPGRTPTPTPTSQPTPTATPTEQPSTQPFKLFLEDSWRTSSSAIQRDKSGGLHAGYYFYESQNDGAPNYAMYAYCATGCDQVANWAKVKLAKDRDVIEVQLALTSAGHPRMLIRADSTVFPGGKDYLYAACDQNCTSESSWQLGYVATTHGTDIFDVTDDDSPQRSFKLDPQDRPRFLFQDRNYAYAEPDLYGHYYASCDSNCTAGTSENPTWKRTRITDEFTENFRFEYEILDFPSLTFSKAGGPRVLANVIPTSKSPTPQGLYYFACDSGCDQRANWQRIYLLDRGSGTEVSWDLELDNQDRPRLAFYRGTGSILAEKLLYLWCNEQCLDQATKDDHWQFNDPGVEVTNGRHPDLELDSQQRPRIAYSDQSAGGLGYVWCNTACESDNAVWQHQTVDNNTALQQSWPVALPLSCDTGLWHGLTPILTLATNDQPTVAYDTTYHAHCFYDDPSDGKPPFTGFHLIVRAARVVAFDQP